jgi:hypothetical protein
MNYTSWCELILTKFGCMCRENLTESAHIRICDYAATHAQ